MPHRLLDALNYNEKKVEQGKAEFLGAAGYLREASKLNFYQKLQGLENRNALNDRASTKTLHVSLNFDPKEKLSSATLFEIASAYMEKIGFGTQPYLVYQHQDAGHPHLHIVSTTIREDGTRIPTHNLGWHQSEKARKELEQTFGLIRAEDRTKKREAFIKSLAVKKIVYGKAETKQSIAAVVQQVLNHYRFTSLAEFNAALYQFGVLADRGKEGGRMYKYKGLVYRILDEKNEKIGVPIKASVLAFKPTLANLEKQFPINEKIREQYKQELITKIEECFFTASYTLQEMMDALHKRAVFTLLRRSAEGKIYGITFVDHQTGCVFNGSDLGKGYSAVAIQRRLTSYSAGEKTISNAAEKFNHPTVVPKAEQPATQQGEKTQVSTENILQRLLSSKSTFDPTPAPLLFKKRKRRKRNQRL